MHEGSIYATLINIPFVCLWLDYIVIIVICIYKVLIKLVTIKICKNMYAYMHLCTYISTYNKATSFIYTGINTYQPRYMSGVHKRELIRVWIFLWVIFSYHQRRDTKYKHCYTMNIKAVKWSLVCTCMLSANSPGRYVPSGIFASMDYFDKCIFHLVYGLFSTIQPLNLSNSCIFVL